MGRWIPNYRLAGENVVVLLEISKPLACRKHSTVMAMPFIWTPEVNA